MNIEGIFEKLKNDVHFIDLYSKYFNEKYFNSSSNNKNITQKNLIPGSLVCFKYEIGTIGEENIVDKFKNKIVFIFLDFKLNNKKIYFRGIDILFLPPEIRASILRSFYSELTIPDSKNFIEGLKEIDEKSFSDFVQRLEIPKNFKISNLFASFLNKFDFDLNFKHSKFFVSLDRIRDLKKVDEYDLVFASLLNEKNLIGADFKTIAKIVKKHQK